MWGGKARCGRNALSERGLKTLPLAYRVGVGAIATIASPLDPPLEYDFVVCPVACD